MAIAVLLRGELRFDPGETRSDPTASSRSSRPTPQLAKADEPAGCFVPKHEPNARNALSQRQSAGFGEIRTNAKHDRQSIKRDPAAEMVDMMDADVGSEPTQHDRKVVMRTAVNGSVTKAPRLSSSPKRILELVLHVEQPHPQRGADEHDRQVHEQERDQAHRVYHADRCEKNREVCRHRAQPRLPTCAHQPD